MEIDIDYSSSKKYSVNDKFTLNQMRTKFAGVVGLSFSVFDDGMSSIMNCMDETNDKKEANRKQDDFSKKYRYIGLVKNHNHPFETDIINNKLVSVKSVNDLAIEFKNVLFKIANDRYKRNLYLDMCKKLESDTMFKDNGFIELLESFFKDTEKYCEEMIKFFKLLSSGHMIIILSLTELCDSIYEKTIVFIDEPETHLHPPLLSTYIRTLSFILRKRNAIAIIATHSPIVLQEVPKSCVTKVERTKKEMSFYVPEIETFASGTDQLTRDIFGYEIRKTGFYKLIQENLQKTFEDTYTEFNEQIGFLGQIMLQGLINNKGDGKNEED